MALARNVVMGKCTVSVERQGDAQLSGCASERRGCYNCIYTAQKPTSTIQSPSLSVIMLSFPPFMQRKGKKVGGWWAERFASSAASLQNFPRSLRRLQLLKRREMSRTGEGEHHASSLSLLRHLFSRALKHELN